MFRKILIANRGEIACRIIRSAQQMDIKTAAIYSDIDRNALHVQRADEAFHVGPAPAADSYLRGDRIVEAARRANADAIHPGYGFLSENADFARRCAQAGIAFIGPSPAAMDAMGSKSAAKRLMEAAGVPLLPGYHGERQEPDELKAAAAAIGYPVMIKAAAGGGGKGMREVASPELLEAALASARREASSSFGDDTVLIERLLTRPRHVEVQVFFDHHGNGIYLGDRDCSIQRRHQKVIEEAPAPGIAEQLRRQMGAAALRAAQAIDYRGAGTVEFLLDRDGHFYFMEMNTRLQVEHPVTEMITGLDLVQWQLLIASGHTLPLKQQDLQLRGHAFEARIYAEDPDNDFLPATGRLDSLTPPTTSNHVRVDSGVRQGDQISVHYDPLIAKLIVWDISRETALTRLSNALSAYRIGGLTTNLAFLKNLSGTRAFATAALETAFIRDHHDEIFRKYHLEESDDVPIAAFALLMVQQGRHRSPPGTPYSPWQDSRSWRLNSPHRSWLTIHCHGSEHTLEIEQQGDTCRVRGCDRETTLSGSLIDNVLCFERAGHLQRATVLPCDSGFTLQFATHHCHFYEVLPESGKTHGAPGESDLLAPMNGTITALLVPPGTIVAANTPLLQMEAMKMEHTIRAPEQGVVARFFCQPGDLVDGGTHLLEFTPAGTESA